MTGTVPHSLQIESGGLEAQDWLRQPRNSLLKMGIFRIKDNLTILWLKISG